MPTLSIPAIYEDGVLRPLAPLSLPEHQQVQLTIELSPTLDATDPLAAWQSVYEGLSEEVIAEVEAIALRRDTFIDDAP